MQTVFINLRYSNMKPMEYHRLETISIILLWLSFYLYLMLPSSLGTISTKLFLTALSIDAVFYLVLLGSGKSFIIYNLLRYCYEVTEGKILVVVPTTSLVEQMYKDFEDYGYDVNEFCHRIYSGKEKNTDKRVIISTWQSIYKFGKDWFEQFDTIFGDEVHLFKAKSLTTMMDKCINAKYRFGLTGTLDGTETNKLVLEGLFGPTFTVTRTVELQKSKELAELDISILLLRYHNDICHMMKDKTYQEELDYIVTYEPRNKFITKIALDQTGNTLVMFQFVEKHGKVLYEMIKGLAPRRT